MKDNRTTVDWSNHTHRREIFKNEKGKKITVDYLQKGDSSVYYVIFINDLRGLTVRGDLGNWIFCKNFYPDSDTESIDDYYWCEKLRIGSVQKSHNFDLEESLKDLNRYVEELQEGGRLSHEEEGELIYWRDEVMNSDSEYDYNAAVFNSVPSCVDYEAIPWVKTMNPRLKYVFDAFEEICRRMKVAEQAVEITENAMMSALNAIRGAIGSNK